MYIYIYIEFPVSLNFWILFLFLLNGPQALNSFQA